MNLKNLLRVLFTLALFVLVTSSTLLAQTTYYVNGVTGNDSWTGTAATFQSGNVGPKKTVQAMVNGSVTGDIIEVAAATYNETVTLTNRTHIKPTGNITVQNVVLNTASGTATDFGDVAGANSLTISGTLTVQTGNYNITTANVVLGTGSQLDVYVGGASAGFDESPTSTAGQYTLRFLNTAALAFAAADIANNNPGNVVFAGSAAVTLPGAITAQGDLTINEGASVALGAFALTVQGGDFTNNGAYSGTAAGGKVVMNTAGGNISGSGTFQNLELNFGGTYKLTSNITFNNVSQSAASLLNVAAGTLDFQNFNISTPGSVTIAGAVAYSGTGATSPGILNLTGDLGTIGTVALTVPGAGLLIENLSITKPSGSTVTLGGGNVTVDNQLNFTGGIFNIGALNLTLSDNHVASAAIGGNINGSGTFTIGAGASANNLTVSGAGQINTPFVVNSATKSVTFTQLTTIGNALTVTSGTLITSSLQLINGAVVVAPNAKLTLNTTNVSVTSNVTLQDGGPGGAVLDGTSNISIAGALALQGNGAGTDAKVDKSAGTVTVAGNVTMANADAFTSAGLTTTTGSIAFAGGAIDINGNLSSGSTLTTAGGVVDVSGNAITAGNTAFGAGNVAIHGFLESGGTVTAGAGVLAVTGNASSVGNFTVSTGTVTVGGNLTTTGGGNVVGAAGALTVTGVVSTAGNITVNTGDIQFNGTGSHTVGGNLLTGAGDVGVSTDLTFGGPVTIAGNPGIAPTHGQEWVFAGAVTLTNGTAKNVDLSGVAAAFTISFGGALSASDLIVDEDFATVVNFNGATSLPATQLANIQMLVSGSASTAIINVNSTSATNYAVVNVSGDITVTATDAASLFNVGANAKVILNGGGDLHAYAAAQNIALTGKALAIANLEINNNGSDSNTGASGGGDGAVNDERLEAVYVTGNILTVTNLTLTNNGLNGNLVTVANGGTVTRSAGSINANDPTYAGTVNLVYTNQADITTGREYTVAATGNDINNLSLTGSGAKVTLTAASGNVAGDVVVAAGRELAMTNGSNNYSINMVIADGAADDNKVVVNGSITGSGALVMNINDAFVYDVEGTGSISNLTLNMAAGTARLNGPASITGNLLTSGGAGTINYTATAPASVGGNLTINVATFTVGRGPLTVGGNLTYTAGNATLAGALNVNGNYSQVAGNLTLNATADVTVNGNYTSTGGALTFPAASTSSFIVKGATLATSGPTTYTFGAGASGRVVFMGAAAQTLTLGANTTIDRLELNTAAGLTMSGIAVNLAVKNLKLTAGTFTHNGLLTMANATDRIIRVDGMLASFPASGPGEVEYASGNSLTTGFELTSLLNKLIINAANDAAVFTLDKNVTILTGGQLNLSRGTLAISSNSLIMQNTTTVTRAEGALTGTPTYGTPTTLEYFNTVSDLTTGPEFTNDGNITTLTINAPTKKVILGANVKVAGNAQIQFGTLDVSTFTFDITGNLDNDAAVAGTTGSIKFTGAGASALTGSGTLSFGNVEVAKNNGVAFTLFPDVAAADFAFNNLTLTDGTFGINAITADDITVNGNFAIGVNFDNFTTANGDDWSFKGNFTINDDATTPLAFTQVVGDVFTFNGTDNQSINSAVALNEVTVNNTAGVTLTGNLIIQDAGILTLTAGRVATGTFYLQVGTTAVGSVARTNGMVLGNMYRFADSDPALAVTEDHIFPMGTADGFYRPVTVSFTGTAAASRAHIIRVTHTNAAPVGTVGIPTPEGTTPINRLAPAYWTVGVYNGANNALLTPGTNPKVSLGAGGFTFGDITKIRGMYRLTNPLNTWTEPGTYGGSFYDLNGVANVIQLGVQGWQLEPQQIFAIGYQSSFVLGTPIANQNLTVGTNFTRSLTSPALFTGAVGTITYTVTSSDSAVAVPSVSGGTLTVNPVAAGTATISITGTDINGDVVNSTFVVTVAPVVTGVAVSGQVTYYNSASTPMSNVTVTLKQGATTVKTATTDASGNFTFTGVAAGEYSLTGTSAKAWGGVNGTDALRLLQYTVGQQTFAPIQVSAANVNNDANVNATDALDILKRTVGQITSFGKGDWVVDSRTVTVAAANVTGQNLVALAVGDVDRSFVPAAAKKSSLVSFVNDGNLEVNLKSEMIELPIRVSGSANVAAMSLSFTYPKDLVEFVAVSSSAKGIVLKNVDGRVNLAWASLEAMNLKAGDAIVTLKFRPTSEFKVGKSVSVEVDNSASEVADINGQAISIALKGASIEAYVPKEFALAQNFPNPFNPATTINYELPVSGTVNLVVYNSIGEVVATLVNGVQEAGPYQVIFNASNLASGIYLYRIDVKGEKSFSKTNKMILMK